MALQAPHNTINIIDINITNRRGCRENEFCGDIYGPAGKNQIKRICFTGYLPDVGQEVRTRGGFQPAHPFMPGRPGNAVRQGLPAQSAEATGAARTVRRQGNRDNRRPEGLDRKRTRFGARPQKYAGGDLFHRFLQIGAFAAGKKFRRNQKHARLQDRFRFWECCAARRRDPVREASAYIPRTG